MSAVPGVSGPEATSSAVPRRRHAAELPILAVLGVGLVLLVRVFVAQAFYIPSGSMLPQLQVQDKVIVINDVEALSALVDFERNYLKPLSIVDLLKEAA